MLRRILLLLPILFLFVSACTNDNAGRKQTPARPLSSEAQTWVKTLDYPDDDRDPERRLAAYRLGVHQESGATEDLARHAMGDRDPLVRAACAFALGRIGGPRAMQTLIALLADPRPELVAEAVRALAGHLDEQTTEHLVDLAGRSDNQTTLLVLRVLAEGGKLTAEQEKLLRKPIGQPTPMRGAAVYVDPANGNDTNDGAEGKPVATIARGVSLLSPSGTLFIAGGPQPIRESVMIPAALSGQPGAPTRLVGWPGKPRPLVQPTVLVKAANITSDSEGILKVKLDRRAFGAFAVVGGRTIALPLVERREDLKPATSWFDSVRSELLVRLMPGAKATDLEVAIGEDGLAVNGANDVEIRGIDVRFALDSGFDVSGALRVALIDCSASYCDRHGIFFYYAPFGVVRDCRATYCNFQGISVRSSPQSVVSRSVAEDNGVDGLLFLYDSDQAVAVDCTLRRNQRGVSFIEGSDYGRVIACEISDNRSNDVAFETGSLGGNVVAAR